MGTHPETPQVKRTWDGERANGTKHFPVGKEISRGSLQRRMTHKICTSAAPCAVRNVIPSRSASPFRFGKLLESFCKSWTWTHIKVKDLALDRVLTCCSKGCSREARENTRNQTGQFLRGGCPNPERQLGRSRDRFGWYKGSAAAREVY